MGSQHPSPNVKTFCKFEPQIWLEIITSRDAKSACFKGSRTSCREIIFGIFWPKFWPEKITSRDGCFLPILEITSQGLFLASEAKNNLKQNPEEQCIVDRWESGNNPKRAKGSPVHLVILLRSSRGMDTYLEYSCFAIPPACYRSLPGPSGPKCPRSVPESVPENGGCPRECPTGCPRDPLGPGLRSVQKVSRECPQSVRTPFWHSGDTLGTLFGDSGARGPKGPGNTPSDTPSDTPHFRGHSQGHSGDTSGPRDSCSRPAGSQCMLLFALRRGMILSTIARESEGLAVSPKKALCTKTRYCKSLAIFTIPVPFTGVLRGPGRKVPHGVLFECFWAPAGSDPTECFLSDFWHFWGLKNAKKHSKSTPWGTPSQVPKNTQRALRGALSGPGRKAICDIASANLERS